MMAKKVLLVFALPLLVGISLLSARENSGKSPFSFEHISVDDGLSQNEVVCMYQDRDGYLWFGTKGGLTRYDGYELTTYRAEPWNDTALSHSSISSLFEVNPKLSPDINPKFHGLWVGTDGGGLNVGNKMNHRYIHYRKDNSTLTSSDMISAIIQDRNGIMWIATLDGFYTFDVNSGSFTRIDYDHTSQLSGKDDEILAMCEDRSGAIWIGTRHGAYRYKDGKSTLIHLERNDDRHGRNLSSTIQVVYEDSRGTVWLGTGGGLYQYDQTKQKVSHVPILRGDPAIPTSNSIVSLLEDRRGFLWVGTINGGVGMFDPRSGAWEWAYHDPGDHSSLSDNTVLSILQDDSGTMWFGTRRGVNKLVPDKVRFQHFRSTRSVDESIVWSVAEIYGEHRPIILVGTQRGLAVLDPTHNQLKPYSPKLRGIELLNQYPVRAILTDGPNQIWVGTIGGGFFRIDLHKGTVDQHIDKRFKPDIYSIADGGDGSLWIGTNGSGLLRYDKIAGTFEYATPSEPSEQEKIEWIVTTHAQKDPTTNAISSILLGTWTYGLVRLEPNTRERRYHVHQSTNVNSLCNNTVFSIHESKRDRGIFWMGTNGGGLCRYNSRDGSFITFTRQDGLPDNVVYGILEDRSGALWLSTNSGLSRFDVRTGEFRNYDRTDGLQSNEFNLGAYFADSHGALYFGGPNGLNRFVPENIINPQPPRVLLTNFGYPGSGAAMVWPGGVPGTIELGHDEGYLSFQFVALHYKKSIDNAYAYMLAGADTAWRYSSTKPDVSYARLAAGAYSFVVKAANCDGVWSSPSTVATVVIAVPYWRTWWFFVLVFTMVVATAFVFHRARLNRAVMLERTATDVRERLRKKLAADFHDEIGHKTTAISMGVKLLGHELRDAPDQVQVQLERIGMQSEQLSREIRSLTWELDPEKDSLLDLAEYLKSIADVLFDSKNVAFRLSGIEPSFDTVLLPIEWRQHLTRIFKEAMHNVAKHANGVGNVTLAFALREQTLEIQLTDDGSGSDTLSSPAGNGITNMHKRAIVLNGSFSIVSRLSGGTTVRFESKLP